MASHELNPDEINRAANVAADYEALQGLTTLMMGVALLFMGISDNILIGSVFLACSAAIGQSHYYKKYGKANTKSSHLWITIAVGLLWVFASFTGLVVDRWSSLPVAVGALACGITLILFDKVQYRHVGPTRVHWLVIVGLLISGLVPMFAGWASPVWLWRYSVAMIGLALVIRGVMDHHRLTRALGPASQQSTSGHATSRSDAEGGHDG